MAEKLGEAVLELRTDDSALTSGMARAQAGAQDLDRSFASVGRNVERSLGGVTSSSKATGVAATELAVAAQTSARAAMDQAAGFGAAANAARVNTLAMRESLVVARELARGNFTRLPGSLTLLAQGIGSQGGIGAFASTLAQQLGLIKQVQNAELAEEAAAAANATAGVEAAARLVAAKVLVADTEVAMAEAQVRVTEGTSAEAAAQTRLAKAHEAVTAAAAEAAVAEDALAVAMGRSAETGAASGAATTTGLTALGTALGVVTAAAGFAFAGFEGFKAEVKDSGDLDKFAEGLRLTTEQIEKAGGSVTYLGHNVKEVTGLTITWGDVARGTFDAVAQAAGLSSSQFKSFWKEAFLETAQVGISAAQVIIGAFASAGTFAKKSGLIGFAMNVTAPGTGDIFNKVVGTEGIAQAGKDAVAEFKKTFGDVGKFFHETLPNDIEGAARARLQKLSDRNNPPKPEAPKKAKEPKRNAADDELAKLAAQIAGENELTQAYLTSDAAVIRAEADQKAMTLAVEKHATASQTAALKQKELALAIATIAAEGAKAISNLNADTTARAKVNAMVAAGLIPASQANQALQNELALRQQVAALALAQEDLAEARHANDKKRIAEDIAAIQRLQGIIQGLPASQAADNAAKNVADAQAQIASNDNEIAQLRLKNALLGDSNKEIATALANLQALQYLHDHPGIDSSTAANLTQSYIQKAQASIQTPFQQWAATVPQTTAAINDALQSIGTKGFDGLSSAITGVITGTESLKSAFHNLAASILADLIQMTIKMLIFKALQMALGGGSIGAPDIGSSMSTTLDTSVAPSLPFSGFHAMGGLIPSGAFGIVGEKGPEPIIATPRGAMVLPNSSLRQGFAANDSAPKVSVTNYNDFRGADPSAVAAINGRVDQMERDLPGRVIRTMGDARSRFVWRGK